MNVNIKNNDKKYTVYKTEGEYKVKKILMTLSIVKHIYIQLIQC